MITTTIARSTEHDCALAELFLATREAAGRAPETVIAYRAALRRFLSTPGLPEDPRKLTTDHLILWMASLRRQTDARNGRPLKPGTLAWHQRHVFTWLGWLYKRRVLDEDIREGVPRISVPRERLRSVTAPEFKRMQGVADELSVEHQRRNLAMLYVLYSTGARAKEMGNLTLADVDFGSRTIRIRSGKGEKERKLAFDPKAKLALMEYVLVVRGDLPGPLFLGRRGRPLTTSGIRAVCRQISARAGSHYSPHDFRRGFAARMRRAGLDLGHVARLLGHSTLTMTLRYSEEGEDDAAISAYRELVG